MSRVKPVSPSDVRNVFPDEVITAFNELIAENLNGSESSYRRQGWDVEYDKPGYCETYSATFTFRKKRPGRSR